MNTETHSIEIACAPEALYAYVTQPWRWHEWHPNSVSAAAPVSRLRPGDRFQEVIEVEPFSPLPIRLQRETSYEVLAADPPERWHARGETRDGWLEIEYVFEPSEQGTRFRRSLTYATTGLSALLMPFLKRRTARISKAALNNLKTRMEAGD